jgi:EAL domain-containing protein (putative c-di-GMP-specific phosphodiesterase class I)/ActR/RegA family two-component response regulator
MTITTSENENLEPQSVLLLDDDLMITEGLAAGLERSGRTLITCNDVEAAEMIVDRFRPSHIVADVRLSGQFGCEGLDFIRYVRTHAPDSRVILMSGDGSDALQLEASERGAVAFFQKPFEVRELDAMLDLMRSSALSPAYAESHLIRMPLIDEILTSGSLRPFFQPIVALQGGARTIGYESLARYRTDSPLRSPEMLFKYAARKQRVVDLELVCLASTIDAAPLLPKDSLVFINLHPHIFNEGSRLVSVLQSSAAQNDIALDRLVLEITEQASLPDSRTSFSAIDTLRDLGVRFAFDDVGIAYSHLPLIGKIRPAFLKISQEFGSGFEQDPTKTKIVRNILSLAADFGSSVVLEGIEEKETAHAAADLGVPYAQGYLFGRPADPQTSDGKWELNTSIGSVQ